MIYQLNNGPHGNNNANGDNGFNNDDDANGDNGENRSNGDSCNIGANDDNDDLKETMMIHRLNNGANGDNNTNGDNGENNSNGDIGNIGANVATLAIGIIFAIGTILMPLKPLLPLATVFYQRIIVVSFSSSLSPL